MNKETATAQSAAGTPIFYTVDGPADAPWLILSNSLATDNRMWTPQVPALTQTHRVIRYDTRGHGSSDVTSGGFSFDDLADDAAAVLDACGADQADFVGLSLGGMTGLAFALKHKDRIGKLVCCDARADAPDPYKTMWDGNIEKLLSGGMFALAEPTIERWFTDTFRNDPANEDTLTLVRAMINSTPSLGYEYAARCLQGLALLPHIHEIACPTLFVVGAADPAAPAEVMRDMSTRVNHADFVVIPDAAHLSNIEQPELFNAAVSSFLNP